MNNYNFEDNFIINSTLYKQIELNDNNMQLIFDKITQTLFNDYNLVINGTPYEINEIEFYLYNKNFHPDVYTHKHKDQNQPCHFYFHKLGQSNVYKGGTYKGLDITFGIKIQDQNNNPNFSMTYGGILIRSISTKSNNKLEHVIGPCKVVDEILKKYNVETIDELINLHKNIDKNIYNEETKLLKTICHDNNNINNLLCFKKKFNPNNINTNCDITVKGPRVGLGFSNPNYVIKNYRYLNNIKINDKYRGTIIINMFKDGITTDNIERITGVKKNQINKYIESYNSPVDDIEKIKGESKKWKPTNTTMIDFLNLMNKIN